MVRLYPTLHDSALTSYFNSRGITYRDSRVSPRTEERAQGHTSVLRPHLTVVATLLVWQRVRKASVRELSRSDFRCTGHGCTSLHRTGYVTGVLATCTSNLLPAHRNAIHIISDIVVITAPIAHERAFDLEVGGLVRIVCIAVPSTEYLMTIPVSDIARSGREHRVVGRVNNRNSLLLAFRAAV